MTRRRIVWLAALLLLITLASLGVAAVVFLPSIVRQAAALQLQALTGRRVAIDQVEVNVFTGHVALRGLRVDQREGPGALLRVDRLDGRLHRRSLLSLRVWIEDLAISGIDVRLVRLPDGRLNVSDLLDRPAQPGGGIELTIDRLRVDGSTLAFEDRTLKPARTWVVERIEIDGRGLSNANAGGRLEFRSVAAGAPLHVKMEDLRLAPLHLSAHVNAANLDLGLLRLYLPGDAAVLPERGILAVGATVVHDATQGTRISAGARVRRLALERRGQDGDFATSPEITITLNDLVVSKGGTFSLGRAEVEGDLSVVEAVRTPSLRYDLTRTRLVAEGLAWPSKRPGRVTFTGGLPGGGRLEIQGTVVSEPFGADLGVKALRLPVDLANRYVGLVGTLGGVADVDLRVLARLEKSRTRITVTGAVGGTRLVVADPARPGEPPLSVERVDASGIEVEWPSRVTVGLLNLRQPRAHVGRDAAGAIALRALFMPRETAAGDASSVRAEAVTPTTEVTLAELRVQEGTLTLVDETLTPAPRFEVTSLTLGVKNVTWPIRGPMQVSLDGKAGGGSVRITGTSQLDRQNARLSVVARDLDVAQAQSYLPFRGRVQGRLSADLDVRGRLEPFRARVRGRVEASDLVLVDGARSLLTLAKVAIGGIDYRAPAHVVIDDVHLVKPFALIERDERGELSLRNALVARPRAPGTAPAASAEGTALKPEVFVKHVLVEDGGTNIVDTSVEPAARLQVRGSRLEVRNLTYPVRMPAEVAIATPMPRGGRLEGRGTFQVDPPRMDVRVTLADVAVSPAQPYLPIAARLGGKVDGALQISGTFDPLALSVRGAATAKDFAISDVNRELLTADRASVEGVDVQWPSAIRVARVRIERPWMLFEREASGRFPLIDLVYPRAAHTQAGPAAARVDSGPRQAAEPLRYEIGALSLTDGFGRFVDHTTDPNFAEELSAVNLTIQGIGNTPPSKARTAIRATLGPDAPLAITGQLGTIGAPLDVDAVFTLGKYAAPRANAYLDTLFGWTARSGTLSLAARYRIEGDELDATNDVGISGLELVRSAPRAKPPKWPIGLPLDTFVSLLKDRRGDIDLSVPVHGRISAPEFDLGDAIWSALRGLAIKVVGLPFAAIGRLFFTEDSRIEALSVNPVTFVPGTATPGPGMLEHLDRLATFLKDKPAVRLQLRAVLSLTDVEPLKREALRARLAARAKDGGEAALREQALRLFARRFPRREPPASTDELLAALAAEDRAPADAEAALGAQRVRAVQAALGARGTDAARLRAPSVPPAVESAGAGRVEFEITQ